MMEVVNQVWAQWDVPLPGWFAIRPSEERTPRRSLFALAAEPGELANRRLLVASRRTQPSVVSL